jgi:hypothetical protein
LDGIEIWNRRDDGWAPRRDAHDLLDGRSDLIEIIGLDFHRRLDFFPLALRLEVAAPLARHGVIEALRSRKCAPEAFGLSAARCFDGVPHAVLSIMDAARKLVSRAARIGE